MATKRETLIATIPGNAGRVQTELRIVELSQERCSLHFDYGGLSFRPTSGGSATSEMVLSEEHGASGGPILCTKASIYELGMGLHRWLESGKLFKWKSGSVDGPRLTLSLCRPEDIITRADKPAFAGTYKNAASFRTSWIYVVDQSCLRDAAEVLLEIGAPTSVH